MAESDESPTLPPFVAIGWLWIKGHKSTALLVFLAVVAITRGLGITTTWPADTITANKRADSAEHRALWAAIESRADSARHTSVELHAVMPLLVGQSKYICRNDYYTAVLFLPCDSLGIKPPSGRSRP